MADNIQLNTGTGGDVLAADDMAGVKHQRVKIEWGPDNTVNEVDDASGKRLPVKVAEELPAGTQNIGDVDVLTLPALPAGSNNIGDVDVLTLPAPLGAAGASSIAKAEDVASANADVGVPAMAVRKATPANTSDTDGDYEMLQMAGGRLWVSATLDAAIPAGTNNIGDVDVLTLPYDVAHDTADSGNPLKIGGKASAALSDDTMVADGDRINFFGDVDGVQLVRPMCPLGDILSERVTITSGTSTALSTFGATANARNYITTIIVYNDTTANDFVDIRDGTAGTVLMTIPLPAKGGAVINLPIPLRQPTTNTALAYDVGTGGSTIYLTFIGFKSKA